MLPVILAMLLILVVGAAVLAYVAFPYRGEEMPVVPVVGDAMRKGVDALPVIPSEDDEHEDWKFGPRSAPER
ncbi:hypothetical protein [Nocardioides houyundeii]|uniref:hypothetical protein n=1 Tax=Nocardioides houyundeii TaxID=2045452 RepID=UPI000C78B572|nr:hypothetical protein [Nocardioides houyundeii]